MIALLTVDLWFYWISTWMVWLWLHWCFDANAFAVWERC